MSSSTQDLHSKRLSVLPSTEWTLPDRGAMVVVLAAPKGGVGKTTATMTLATLLAREGKRVLVVDMDPQINSTTRLDPVGFSQNISTAMQTPDDIFQPVWSPDQFLSSTCSCKVHWINQLFYLIPGDPEFEQTLKNLANPPKKVRRSEILTRFRRGMDAERPYFHYILVDTPPGSNSELYEYVLDGADAVLVPNDGLDSVSNMASFLTTVQARDLDRKMETPSRPALKLFLFSSHMAQSDSDQCNWFQLLLKFFPKHCAKTVIHHSASVAKTAAKGVSWSNLTPRTKLAYRELAKELFGDPSVPGSGLLHNPKTPPLTEWLEQKKLEPRQLFMEAMRLKASEGRLTTAYAVKFQR